MPISFIDPAKIKTSVVVVPAYEGSAPEAKLLNLGKKEAETLATALKNQDYKGKKGTVAIVPALGAYGWVAVVGLGKKADVSPLILQEIGGDMQAGLASLPVEEATLVLPEKLHSKIEDADVAAYIATGFHLRSYAFDKYKTKKKDDEKPKLKKLSVATPAYAKAKKAYEPLAAVAKGVFLARDLQNEPANIIYPETLAKAAVDALSGLGVKVEVLGEKEMEKLGMGALLGVGQGSVRESQLVVMQYHGNPKSKDAPVALVGKGVTFDTGGISIKPSAGMEDMKWDMGGSAVVIGTMLALAGRQAKVNAVGVIGLVENMPSGTAQRPGDIVTSMSGQTIEVLNTDAEGRLVLADALWYTQENFKPAWIVDFATLTGAIVVALGEITAGLFSNNDKLAKHIEQAADATGEALWRLPLKPEYDKDMDSDFADMKNIGSGRGAGSITAAQFLQRFIKDGQAWAHIDIAGVTWAKKPTSLFPKGATAYGVRLMDTLIAQHYEGK